MNNYDFNCPNCGAPYKYDQHSYHFTKEGMKCVECEHWLDPELAKN